MEDLKEIIKEKYSHHDSVVLSHGYDYFLTASKIYQDLEADSTYNIYPLLTLLGISAELFFKAFDITVNEEYRNSSVISKNVEPNNRIHNLEKLFKLYSSKDQELFNYLVMSYNVNTERDLQSDLLDYASVFIESRYIFQYDERKYLDGIGIVFHLVESLYVSINSLYEK